jgi:hypothetical protein
MSNLRCGTAFLGRAHASLIRQAASPAHPSASSSWWLSAPNGWFRPVAGGAEVRVAMLETALRRIRVGEGGKAQARGNN